MMGIIFLTITALCGFVDDPDAASSLVRRLGSERFAERVEATRALEKLGSQALPALRAASDSPDPRVRARVAPLLKRLEQTLGINRLTQARQVRLDFHDRPLYEVVDELNARNRFGLVLQNGPLAPRGMVMFNDHRAKKEVIWGRRISLESPEPLPFWTAIDRLCEAGRLQQDLHPQAGLGLPAGQFLLYSGLGGSVKAFDSGPIRFALTRLDSTFENNLAEVTIPPGVVRQDAVHNRGNGDLDIRMTVVPEPGLIVRLLGKVKLEEATDDRGRSLLPHEPAPPDVDDPSQSMRQPSSLNGSSGFDLGVRLHLIDQESRSIKRLRGSVSVVIVGFALNPIVMALKDGVGKTAMNDEVTITLLEVVDDPQYGMMVEAEVISKNRDGRQPMDWPQRAVLDLATFGTDQLTNRIELVDANGRELALDHHQVHARDFRTSQHRVRLSPTILYEDQPAGPDGRFASRKPIKPVPVELRYHNLIQTVTEIRFDFHDVPLP